MGKPNFSDEFKRDAVAQITECEYPVVKVLTCSPDCYQSEVESGSFMMVG